MVLELIIFEIFFVKQKTAYVMRISDWSSDVCSSDLKDIDLLAVDANGARKRRTGTVGNRETASDQRRVDFGARGGGLHQPEVEAMTAGAGLRAGCAWTTAAICGPAIFTASGRKIGRASCRERVCQ